MKCISVNEYVYVMIHIYSSECDLRFFFIQLSASFLLSDV